MQLSELLHDARRAVCDAYSFPMPLLNENEVKYNNLEIQIRRLYGDAIIPDSVLIADFLTDMFNLKSENLEFYFDFSDVISISAEQKEKQEIKSIKIENIVKIATAYSRGEINRNFAEHILSTEFDIDNEKIDSLLGVENKEVIDNIENKK